MPNSIYPTTYDIPPVKQDVRLHIWGRIDSGSLAGLMIELQWLELAIDCDPFDHHAALQPGGVRIRNVAWGDMPSGFLMCLRRYGLSGAWFTQPVGFVPTGSYLSHAGLGVEYALRIGPAWSSYDLLRPHNGCRGPQDRIAACLFDLAPRLGVLDAMSNHQRLLPQKTLIAAHEARCVEQLEIAAGKTPPPEDPPAPPARRWSFPFFRSR